MANGFYSGSGQNTDPQSMDYLYGLPKWTTPENHLEGEKQLFQALNKLFLHIPFAFAGEIVQIDRFHVTSPNM